MNANKAQQIFVLRGYGIEPSRMSENRIKRLHDKCVEIHSTINRKDGNLIGLYKEVQGMLDDSLASGNNEQAWDTYETLNLILCRLDKLKHSAPNKIEDALREQLDWFDVDGRRGDLKKLKEEIGYRMENPVYGLERRMRALVKAEKYEEAARVRDEMDWLKKELSEEILCVGDMQFMPNEPVSGRRV